MTAEDLFEQLVASGVRLSVNGDLLTFTAPKGALTPERMALMRRHKQELICLVGQETRAADTPASRYRATFGQESLWLLHQSDPSGASYNTAAAIRIFSPVDAAALQRSLTRLQLRHESLRTTFTFHEDQLFAEARPDAATDFRIVDAHALDDRQLQELCQAEYAAPFNLQAGPPFRSRLLTRTVNNHVLLLVVHHIVFDASSLWLLQDELQQLYAAESTGRPCLLPAVVAPFREYADWQREFAASPDGERQWEVWRQQLAGDPAPGEIPWNYDRPRHGTRRGETISASLGEAVGLGLRQLAKTLQATPFATALAVYQALVCRYSNQRDFVIGTTTAGRTQRRFSDTIGFFVNVLPLRTSIDDTTTFAALVQQTKQSVFSAMEASDYPFAQLVRRLKPLRAGNAPPLCRMVFGLQKPHAFAEAAQLLDSEEGVVDWGGLRVQRYPLKQQEGQFDLTLELYEGVRSFDCVLKYDRNLMSDQAARRFLRHYTQLMQGVTADPHRELQQYSLCDAAEHKMLADWSVGESLPTTEQLTLDQVFAASVARHPEKVALAHDQRCWSYRELDRWATGIARSFRAQGVRPGDRIVVCTGRHAIVPALLLAVFKCGAVYVPVAPDSPGPRLAISLSEVKPAIVIVDDSRYDVARESVPHSVLMLRASSFEPAILGATCADAAPGAGPQPADAAYIISTSGSSGIPKAVVVSHRAICLHVAAMARVYRMNADDRVLQFSDLTFDPSLEQFLVAWSVGATVVMRGEAMYTGDAFWSEVNSKQVTVANVPPSLFALCTEHICDAPQLRLVVVGGDVFPGHLLPRWRASNAIVMNAYGPTEAVITASTFVVSEREPQRRVPVGTPKPGSRAWVLDKAGRMTGIGVPGELCLGGPMLAEGYLSPIADGSDPFQFIEIEAANPERVYRTGDMARWTEAGEIEFLGRLDRQVKIRGFRIEPGEIETVLSEHPNVRQVFVRICEDRQQRYLAAYVVPREPSAFDALALVGFLKARLPVYMVPERIGMVAALPFNDAGKVAANALPDLPAVATLAPRTYAPPRNAVERLMVAVWAEILEVENVGIHDDYYALGGGSLQSLRIVSRLRERGVVMHAPGEDLNPQLLFQYETIAELSPLLTRSSSSAADVNTIATDICPTIQS